MSSTAGSYSPPILPGLSGQAELPATVNMLPPASGAWINSALIVELPQAGRYRFGGSVRANLSVDGGTNVWMAARLVVVQDGQTVPLSERLISQHLITVAPAGTTVAFGDNRQSDLGGLVDVPGPRTIRLELQRNDADGQARAASVLSDANGRTVLTWELIG